MKNILHLTNSKALGMAIKRPLLLGRISSCQNRLINLNNDFARYVKNNYGCREFDVFKIVEMECNIFEYVGAGPERTEYINEVIK
jgi:hypothetical protein